MLEGFKRLQLHDLKKNTLEHVSKKVLGEDSEYAKLSDVDEDVAWKEDPQTFVEYNRRDVMAVVEIEKQENILSTFDHLRSVSGAKYSECNHAFGIIDMVMLRKARDNDIILPTSQKPDEDWFYGGYVYDYKAGKHRNCVYPDLASLYPNTIRMLNISPETYIGDEFDLKFSPYDEDDCLWGYVDNRPVKIVPTGSDYDQYKNGEYKAIQRRKKDGTKKTVWIDEPQRERIYYLKPDVKQGFVSSVVDDLLEMKYEYKGGDKYTAIKVIANAVWGVFGDSNTFGKGFRLFQRELAETITLAGREILKSGGTEITEYIQEQGYDDARLVGGDTDSMITTIPSACTRDSAIRVSQDACQHMNDEYYPEWGQERFNLSPERNLMEIELESYANSMFVPSDTSSDDPEKGVKKTYAQWVAWDEGDEVDEIEYKGLEVVRSDTAEITQDVQREVIETILRENTSTAKEHCYEYVREVANACLEGDIDLSRLAKSQGISKTLSEYGTDSRRPTTHIRGAKYADKHIDGENLWTGGKPMTVYVSDVDDPYPNRYSAETPEDGDKVDAISVEDTNSIPNEVHIDYEEHLQKTVLDPLKRVFKGMEWSLDEAINNYRQKGLGDFHKT
jgi:DNA polymerase I